MALKDSFWLRIIYIVSILITLVVFFLILGPRPEGMGNNLDVSYLPKLNATLNGICAVLLVVGYILIRNRRRKLHMNVMLTAFGISTAFLISYIIYHWFKSGPKLYTGEWMSIYLFILFTHIILAAVIIPLALVTLYRGWNDQLSKHRKIARITLPLWLYVSVTGVVIYWMLY